MSKFTEPFDVRRSLMVNENWNPIIEDEVWECQSFFPETMMAIIGQELLQSESIELSPGQEIREKFRSTGANPTLYSYKIHQTRIREMSEISTYIMSHLGRVLKPLGYPETVLPTYNPLQIFVKSFSSHSFYELHSEPLIYGEFAYLIFLDTVDFGGELIFPDKLGAEKYLLKYPGQRTYWEENKELIKREGSEVRYIGPLTIRPERNKAMLFRVGSAHYVESFGAGKNEFRHTVAGWPYATERLINGLEKNCKLSDHFSPQDKT